MRNELARARQRAAELIEIGEANRDPVSTWTGHRLLGTTCYPLGEFATGRAHLERAIAIYEAEVRPRAEASERDDPQSARLRVFDEGHVLALVYAAYNLLYLGHLDEARRHVAAALEHARQRPQAYTFSHARTALAFIELMTNSPRAALASIDELGAFTEGADISYYASMGLVFRGWCLAALGEARRGMDEIRRGIADYRAMGNLLYVPSFLKFLGEACAWARELAAGAAALDEADTIATASQAHHDEAEIARVRGEVLAVKGETAGAEASFRAAVELARRQQAKLLELRAAVGLARLLRATGRRAAAREALAPVYGWFSEGFATAALVEAKALLDAPV
jgi:tetratricopeptide (TPR) repeat protein